MDKYKTIRVKYGWIGLFQTTINFKNWFRFSYRFVRSFMFCLAFGGFVWPNKYGGTHRDLFCVYIYQGYDYGKNQKRKYAYLSISLLYINLSFWIGGNNTWFKIRSHDYEMWRCSRINKRNSFGQ